MEGTSHTTQIITYPIITVISNLVLVEENLILVAYRYEGEIIGMREK
jgi:hypothetical protein